MILLAGLMAATGMYANEVVYYWAGAVTTTSVKVNAVLQLPADKVRLMVSTSREFSQPIYSAFSPARANHENTVSLEVTGLQPGTLYYYAIEMDGETDRSADDIGQFTTYTHGAFSFRFAVGSCAFLGNNRVYDEMRNANPLFFLATGDLHYANPSSTDVQQHRTAYEDRVLSQPREAKFFQCTPIAYVWDDHDFCGDNNIGSDGCGAAAKKAYLEYVPHYPVQAPDSSNAIYQAFTVGRVRFILSDLRAERISGDIMSRTQKEWLKKEMITARDQGQIIAWMSSVSYSGTGKDNWGGFATTRQEMADFLRDNRIENLFILSGDAHMLAIDNGENADFSTGHNSPYRYPIFQAAALNNVGSYKGGEFSEGGHYPNTPFTSQWGIVDVTDNGGDEICIDFHGYRLNTLTDAKAELVKYHFCRKLVVR